MTTPTKGLFVTGLLLMGEYLGFTASRIGFLWPWLLGLWCVGALALWGWQVRYGLYFAVFTLGIILALRTAYDARYPLLEQEYMNRGGAPPTYDLTVESEVTHLERKDGETLTFASHLGALPLKVRIPHQPHTPLPHIGETWRCSGWIALRTRYPGPFACRTFACQTGVPCDGTDVLGCQRMQTWLTRLGACCADYASRGLSWCPKLAALNRAILLGRRSDLSYLERQMFVAAGTIHVFAISGLHVMMVALILSRITTALGISILARGLLVLPVLTLYILITGARPSAIRAGLMAAFWLLGPVFGRRSNLISTWSLTALLVYGYHPERLFDTGCSLSFGVMLGIALWLRYVLPHIPEKAQQGIWGIIGVSFAAWVAGTPIAAHIFGRFTMGSLLANLAVLPLAGLTMAFGLAGIAFAVILPPLALIFNNLTALMTFGMRLVSVIVADIPGSTFVITPWSWGTCLLWYAVWIGALTLILKIQAASSASRENPLVNGHRNMVYSWETTKH